MFTASSLKRKMGNTRIFLMNKLIDMRILTTLFLLASITTFAQTTLIQCGNLFDAEEGKMKGTHTIIINKDTITVVEKGIVTPRMKDATIIDLKEYTVLPGLIDLHVHIESETNPNKYLEPFQLTDADVAFNSQVFAKTTLMAGFTTVRDVGGRGVNIALGDAIDKGKVVGPRIFTSGKALATTGGHADPTSGNNYQYMGDPKAKEGVVNGVASAKKAVRQRYKNGADLIKITATGGVLSVAKNSSNPQFSIDEIKAITSTAKDYGFHVAAHAHGDKGMQRAILGGVKTIEHGTLMSEETIEMMKENDVYLVPTIIAGKYVSKMAKVPDYYPEVVVPKALSIGPKIQSTFGKAYENGVPIAFGTDAGVFPHGENAKEFQYMTEAGMSLFEALRSATITNAEILKMDGKLGQIKKGFFADIIAVKGKLEESSADKLTNIKFVMKSGKIHKQPKEQ